MTESGSDVREAIAAANKRFVEAVSHGDAAALAALYTDDGQVLPPNAGFVTGQEAVQGFWQAVLDMGVKEAELSTIEVEGLGDTAIEISQFTLYGAESQLVDKGKYIVVWKREDGGWKLHRDIFNSSMPPPE
jgi:uncharacterized protein (TIGR02246 family)